MVPRELTREHLMLPFELTTKEQMLPLELTTRQLILPVELTTNTQRADSILPRKAGGPGKEGGRNV